MLYNLIVNIIDGVIQFRMCDSSPSVRYGISRREIQIVALFEPSCLVQRGSHGISAKSLARWKF